MFLSLVKAIVLIHIIGGIYPGALLFFAAMNDLNVLLLTPNSNSALSVQAKLQNFHTSYWVPLHVSRMKKYPLGIVRFRLEQTTQ